MSALATFYDLSEAKRSSNEVRPEKKKCGQKGTLETKRERIESSIPDGMLSVLFLFQTIAFTTTPLFNTDGVFFLNRHANKEVMDDFFFPYA